MSTIVILRNQFGRTPTRGKSNARPLSSGMEIFNFIRRAGHWFSPNLCDLVASIVSRVRDRSGAGARNHGRSVPFQFARAVQAARRLFPLVNFFQKPASGLTKSFQVLSLLPVHVVKHGRRTRQDAVTARQERGYE